MIAVNIVEAIEQTLIRLQMHRQMDRQKHKVNPIYTQQLHCAEGINMNELTEILYSTSVVMRQTDRNTNE